MNAAVRRDPDGPAARPPLFEDAETDIGGSTIRHAKNDACPTVALASGHAFRGREQGPAVAPVVWLLGRASRLWHGPRAP